MTDLLLEINQSCYIIKYYILSLASLGRTSGISSTSIHFQSGVKKDHEGPKIIDCNSILEVDYIKSVL